MSADERGANCQYCGHARNLHDERRGIVGAPCFAVRYVGSNLQPSPCTCRLYVAPGKRRIPPLPKVPFVQDQDFSTIEKIDAEIAFAEYAIRHEAENRTGETDNESWGQLNWNLNERYKMALEMLKDAKRALKRAGVDE